MLRREATQVMRERALRQQESAARDQLQEMVTAGVDDAGVQVCV